jgi:hypothetical protein
VIAVETTGGSGLHDERLTVNLTGGQGNMNAKKGNLKLFSRTETCLQLPENQNL